MGTFNQFPEDGILFGLLVGTWLTNGITRESQKYWSLHLYNSEKARGLGLRHQKREYPHSDCLTVELSLKELFSRATPTLIVMKERYHDGDVLAFLQDQRRGRKT